VREGCHFLAVCVRVPYPTQGTGTSPAVSTTVILQAVQIMSTVVTSSQDQLSPRAVQATRNTIDGVAASGAIGVKVGLARVGCLFVCVSITVYICPCNQ
jgi:hypothetical protein